jgi:hypothetical protein
VRKIKIVVGCRRIHAGTQPLNINIAPSFLSEDLITPSVDCGKKYKDKQIFGSDKTRKREIYVGPWA